MRVYYFTNGHVINQAGAYLEIFIRGRFSTGLMMFLCIFWQALLKLCVHFVLLFFIAIGLISPGSGLAGLDPQDEDEKNGENLARLDGFWSCHGGHVVSSSYTATGQCSKISKIDNTEIFFDQIPFFAISKMAKIQFLNWEIV